MSTIDLSRKKFSFSPLNTHHEFQNICDNISSTKNIVISIIITESTASILNITAHHLQDIKENANKSKICLVIDKKSLQNTDGYNRLLDENVAYFRIVPMEESSTSIYAMDDLSDVLIQEKNAGSMQNITQLYLGPHFVNTKSLMTVCTIAHDSNLLTDTKNVYVNVNYDNLPITSSGWINMCRICHGSDSQEDLIGPCHCKGSIALAHLSCLERWLKESARSYCELCLHHYEIKRQPKYGLLKSVFMWLHSPGEHTSVLIDDLVSFCLYTPAAICSTYILSLVCECAARNALLQVGNPIYPHIVAFFAISGIAAIDFTYSSWIMMRLHLHIIAWRQWYRDNCCLTLILPPRKLRRRRGCTQPQSQ